MSDAGGSNAVAVTTDGSEKDRIKYGTASWVYGEELGQTSAMWWSPDGSKLAFYRFDESKGTAVTKHPFEVAGIVRVDEQANALYYMVRDGDNHMKLQLHRVGLDRKNDRRLTDVAFNQTIAFAPDGKYFIDVVQAHDTPPMTRLASADGKVVAEVATSDVTKYRLGTVEIDDQAAGVTALSERPYIDRNRVGIFGTSFGGYASGLALLRYPTVFAAASSSSPVTDWRHYDTIYTERYMWLPDENKAGYDAGSLLTYADKLKGRLMLYWGTADNNVHPSNMMQLVASLQRSGKSFDVQVGPDRGHSGLNTDRVMEFFIENLVMRNPGTATAF